MCPKPHSLGAKEALAIGARAVGIGAPLLLALLAMMVMFLRERKWVQASVARNDALVDDTRTVIMQQNEVGYLEEAGWDGDRNGVTGAVSEIGAVRLEQLGGGGWHSYWRSCERVDRFSDKKSAGSSLGFRPQYKMGVLRADCEE